MVSEFDPLCGSLTNILFSTELKKTATANEDKEAAAKAGL